MTHARPDCFCTLAPTGTGSGGNDQAVDHAARLRASVSEAHFGLYVSMSPADVTVERLLQIERRADACRCRYDLDRVYRGREGQH